MSQSLYNVSVIIPCCNQADTLPRAVQSAIAARASDVIIVDDADDANITEVIRANDLDGFINVRHLESHNIFPMGVSASRNWGVSEARNEWVLPLDADDELLPGAIDELFHYNNPGKAVYGDYVVNDAQIANADPGMIYRKSVCHATVLFSKEDWLRVGGYKPEFNVGCEDWEFLLSLVEAGVNLTHVNAPIYRKTINPDGRGAKCLERRPLIASLLKEYHPKVQL